MTEPTERARCVERVYSPRMFGSAQCSRKSVSEHEGKPYCRQHHPEVIEARAAERRKRWAAEDVEREKSRAKATRDRAWVEACERWAIEADGMDPSSARGFAIDRDLFEAISAAADAYTAALGEQPR